jgi:hypothetical protein
MYLTPKRGIRRANSDDELRNWRYSKGFTESSVVA